MEKKIIDYLTIIILLLFILICMSGLHLLPYFNDDNE